MTPVKLVAEIVLPMVKNTSIRQRQAVYLLSLSCRACMCVERGVEVLSISLSTTMNRFRRWMRSTTLYVQPE
jgi:hypothetical protein